MVLNHLRTAHDEGPPDASTATRAFVANAVMTTTLSAHDIRGMVRQLDRIKELTELLRHAHYEVPVEKVYGAAGAEDGLRATLMRVCLQDVAVEVE
jgi:hypothetical protein